MVTFLSIMLCALVSANIQAHGLDINTANVFIRNQNHVVVRINYFPLRLLNRLEQEKKFPLPFWANMSESELEKHYKKLKKHFQTQLSVKLDNKPIQSLRFFFPPTKRLQAILKQQLAHQLMQSEKPDKEHQHHAQRFHLRADGFVPQGASPENLMVNFPPELGELMVTYSKPVVQTIKTEDGTLRYQQNIH